MAHDRSDLDIPADNAHPSDKDTESEPKGVISRRSLLIGAGAVVASTSTGVAAAEANEGRGRGSPRRGDAVCGPDGPEARMPVEVTVYPRRLESGSLLITDQFNSKIYVKEGSTLERLIDVRSWGTSHLWDAVPSTDRRRVFVSLSGLRAPSIDYVGLSGVSMILEIDLRSGRLLRVFSSLASNGFPYRDRFIDVSGMVLRGDRLLVNDFFGFASRGRILSFDVSPQASELQEPEILIDGLLEPAGLSADGPNHVLVGNARMPGGAELGGQAVRVNTTTGESEVLFNIDLQTGALIGVSRLPDGQLIATISDWPAQITSRVIRIVGPTNFETLYAPDLAFFSSQIGVVGDGSFWVGESVSRDLLHFDRFGNLAERINVDQCFWRGSRPLEPLDRAFDTLESVRVVG